MYLYVNCSNRLLGFVKYLGCLSELCYNHCCCSSATTITLLTKHHLSLSPVCLHNHHPLHLSQRDEGQTRFCTTVSHLKAEKSSPQSTVPQSLDWLAPHPVVFVCQRDQSCRPSWWAAEGRSHFFRSAWTGPGSSAWACLQGGKEEGTEGKNVKST